MNICKTSEMWRYGWIIFHYRSTNWIWLKPYIPKDEIRTNCLGFPLWFDWLPRTIIGWMLPMLAEVPSWPWYSCTLRSWRSFRNRSTFASIGPFFSLLSRLSYAPRSSTQVQLTVLANVQKLLSTVSPPCCLFFTLLFLPQVITRCPTHT